MADDKSLAAEIDAALAGGTSATVIAAGAAAVPPLAARLATADSAEEKAALLDLLGAIGTPACLAPMLPFLSDPEPDLRTRASFGVLEVVLDHGAPADATGLNEAVMAALAGDKPEGGVLLLAGLVPGAEAALSRHAESDRLVKAQPYGPAAPSSLAVAIALSARGDSRARAALEIALAEADDATLEFTLRALPLIDAPTILLALARPALASEAPVGEGRPSGTEPPKRLADLAVEAYTSRLGLTPSFPLAPEYRYGPEARAEIARLVAEALPI